MAGDRGLLCADTGTASAARHDFGSRLAGEAGFIPQGDGEGEGLLATFLHDPTTATSDLPLLGAARVEEEPIATVRLPQQVPQGLHGIWVPG